MEKTKKFHDCDITERIRVIVGANKKAFAKKADILYESVRLWCKGACLPQVEHLIKLKNNMGINIDWLLSGSHDVKQDNFMCDWPEDAIRACNDLKEILDFGEKREKEIILSTIEQAKKIRDLKKPVAGLSSERRKKNTGKYIG